MKIKKQVIESKLKRKYIIGSSTLAKKYMM